MFLIPLSAAEKTEFFENLPGKFRLRFVGGSNADYGLGFDGEDRVDVNILDKSGYSSVPASELLMRGIWSIARSPNAVIRICELKKFTLWRRRWR